jgi:hypothetical protein
MNVLNPSVCSLNLQTYILVCANMGLRYNTKRLYENSQKKSIYSLRHKHINLYLTKIMVQTYSNHLARVLNVIQDKTSHALGG